MWTVHFSALEEVWAWTLVALPICCFSRVQRKDELSQIRVVAPGIRAYKLSGTELFVCAGANLRGNRSKLPKIAKKHPESLEVSSNATDLNHMARYRMNVYAYGHCGWSRRIHELCMMKTAVLMEDSPCREYMHWIFKPGKHYLPVAADFSDLHEVVQKAHKDGLDIEGMARKWSELGRESLTLACTLDYVDALLRKLAALQRFTPVYHPEWSEYTLDRNRMWFSKLYRRNTSECVRPHFVHGVRTLPC